MKARCNGKPIVIGRLRGETGSNPTFHVKLKHSEIRVILESIKFDYLTIRMGKEPVRKEWYARMHALHNKLSKLIGENERLADEYTGI